MERAVRRRKASSGGEKVVLFIAAAVIIVGIIAFFAVKGVKKDSELYISKALASRMLVLLKTDMPQSDVADNPGSWYIKYMEYLCEHGEVMWDADDYTAPEYAYTALTYGELRTYLVTNGWNVGDISDYTDIPVDKSKASKKVERDDFDKIYDYFVLMNGNAGGVIRREITIIGTPANMTAKQIRQYGQWNCVALEGSFCFEGLAMDAYSDRTICVYTRGNQIISVLAQVADEVTYPNIWITKAEGGKLCAYVCGVYREFEVAGLKESFKDTIGDIRMKDGRLAGLTIKKDTISGKVLKVSSESIEIEGYGSVSVASDFRVYKNYGELSQAGLNDILVGYSLSDFVVADGMICAAVINKELHADDIRVLIMSTGYGSIFHERVTLTSEQGFSLKKGDEVVHIEAGELLDIYSDSEYMSEGRIILEPDGINNSITILSIERSYGNPYYSGTLEISCEEGGLVVINELPLEEYLYHVVPSEMPVSFGVEALKVQAVCARSYAYRHILNNSYRIYGAHVDDSVNYQVYNNIKEQPDSNQAVKETYGQVISKDSQVVAAYYYSTSCGYMSDLTVWGGTEDGIYKAKTVNGEGRTLDLSDEDSFRDFIYNTNSSDYDYEFPFYRWNVELDMEYLTERINNYLAIRYVSEPSNILMKNEDGEYVSGQTPYVGNVLSLEVAERTTSGAVRRLIIHGMEGDAQVCGELNIRYVLGPGGNPINTHIQTETSFDFLPSAYICLEEMYEEGAVTGYRITGGGYGHGIGMSQNAVSSMVKQGMRYDDILEFFYNGIDIVNIYN